VLGEDIELKPDVRFYQRLVALDREGALEVVESVMKDRPRVEVFDHVLIPTLTRAARDAARDELDETDQEFVWQVTSDLLDRLEAEPELGLETAAGRSNGSLNGTRAAPALTRSAIVGLPAHDQSDALVLRMLGQLLAAEHVSLEILVDTGLLMQVTEAVGERDPRMVVVSNLPAEGVTMARYLVRRVKARYAELPVVLGLWGESGDAAPAAVKLAGNEASRVVFTLAEARDRILQLIATAKVQQGAATAAV
jgi:hypothetical protein